MLYLLDGRLIVVCALIGDARRNSKPRARLRLVFDVHFFGVYCTSICIEPQALLLPSRMGDGTG